MESRLERCSIKIAEMADIAPAQQTRRSLLTKKLLMDERFRRCFDRANTQLSLAAVKSKYHNSSQASSLAMSTSIPPDRLAKSESMLRTLLESFHSRYSYIMQLDSAACTKRCLTFSTEWCIPPTPAQPVPQIRIHIEFRFLYDTRRDEVTGEKIEILPPSVTYRIENESTVHRIDAAAVAEAENSASPTATKKSSTATSTSANVDHHIARQIKMKSLFFASNPLPLTEDQKNYFDSRLAYEPIPDAAAQESPREGEQATAEA